MVFFSTTINFSYLNINITNKKILNYTALDNVRHEAPSSTVPAFCESSFFLLKNLADIYNDILSLAFWLSL